MIDPKNFRKTIQRIVSVDYKIPNYVHVSHDCKQLLARIVANRITMKEIKSHPWFLEKLPRELTEAAHAAYYKRDKEAPTNSLQAVDDIMKIVREARTHGPSSKFIPDYGWAEDVEEQEENKDDHEMLEKKEDENVKDKVKMLQKAPMVLLGMPQEPVPPLPESEESIR